MPSTAGLAVRPGAGGNRTFPRLPATAVTMVISIRARVFFILYGGMVIFVGDRRRPACTAAEGGDVAAAKVREASDAIARLVKS